ncbi:MAG: DNA-primase RepB domain-containing protein [Betaproteobacteria bacterium]|nr:DNA-primase RepB domain-containing protein [Betaproteobacteria bacterium]
MNPRSNWFAPSGADQISLAQAFEILQFWKLAGARKIECAISSYRQSDNCMGGFFWPAWAPGAFPRILDIHEEIPLFEAVHWKLLRFQKNSGRPFSIYWRPVDAGDFVHRLIFLDDIQDIAPFSQNRHVALETSPSNYQVWLMLEMKPSIERRLEYQGAVREMHGGDPGAGGKLRWTRMPGSINRKLGKENFITRLVNINMEGKFVDPSKLNLKSPHPFQVNVNSPGLKPKPVMKSSCPLDLSPAEVKTMLIEYNSRGASSASEHDIKATMSLIKKGVNDDSITNALIEIAADRNKNDPVDYANRTVRKAHTYLSK